ncbi:GerMN domain-containing protein [bacterium]|jgi:hypothetical protein|nr:GerMN domain-containing protein [bacterium]
MTTKRNQLIIGIVLLLIAGIFFLMGSGFNNQEKVISEGIEIYDIKDGQIIESPLLIKGIVTGGKWTGFEGQVGRVEVVDSEGKLLGVAPLMMISDFMKLPISFEANLVFDNSKEDYVSLVFYNENPSGIMGNSEMKSFLVKTLPRESVIKLYFGKQGDNSCTNLYSIEREIVKVEGIAKSTIEELLKGLTAEEKEAGYFTSINEGVKINSLTIVDGTAKIDFDGTLEKSVGGSCRVAAIRQQITQTLMQFSSIKKVIISVDGRTEDILQP